MKRMLAVAVAILTFAVLAACQTPPITASEPTATVPYITLGIDVPYETIAPMEPGEAKEIRIALPTDIDMPEVYAWPDGSSLAIGEKVTYEGTGDEKKLVSTKIMAEKYDTDGQMVWSKVYSVLGDGYISQAKALPDGGFVFTYETVVKQENSQYIPNTQHIVFCTDDGHVFYQESSDQQNAYQYIVVPNNSFLDIMVASIASTGNGTSQISILKHGGASDLFFTSSTLDGYSYLSCATWSQDAGMLLSADKSSAPGVQAQSILSVDASDLNLRWEYCMAGQDRLMYDQLSSTSGGILASGRNVGKTFILKLDNDGNKLWQISPDGEGDYSVICMAAYPDGRFAAAINRYKQDDPNHGEYLAVYGADGSMIQKTKLPNETLREIIPTDDGGLLTVGIQDVKTLPQPAYINSIWFDTETIVTKYDGNLNIQWRKVYDKYKDSTRPDIAVPLADGSVIVEK